MQALSRASNRIIKSFERDPLNNTCLSLSLIHMCTHVHTYTQTHTYTYLDIRLFLSLSPR